MTLFESLGIGLLTIWSIEVAALVIALCVCEGRWRALLRAKWEAQAAASGKRMFVPDGAETPGRLLPPIRDDEPNEFSHPYQGEF